MSVPDDDWVTLRRGSVSDLIAEQILRAIDSEKLRPGDKLPAERELAVRLGTSRPSLREALRSLKAQGFVEIRHGSGVYVADRAASGALRAAIESEQLDLEELFGMRELLEVAASGWAARNQDVEGLDRLSTAFAELDEYSRSPEMDWDHLRHLDSTFHLRIVMAAGNRYLAQTQSVLQGIQNSGMQTTLRLPGRLECARGEHREIYDAIVAADPARARRAAKTHIGGARRAAMQHLREQGARRG